MDIPASVPAHLEAAQLLINRCASAEERKAVIVMLGSTGAIDRDDAVLLIQANQLETA